MTPLLLDTWLQGLQVLCDLEGAKAENAFRESCGKAPAYAEDYFACLRHQLDIVRSNIQ
jgi:hypothetical protein